MKKLVDPTVGTVQKSFISTARLLETQTTNCTHIQELFMVMYNFTNCYITCLTYGNKVEFLFKPK